MARVHPPRGSCVATSEPADPEEGTPGGHGTTMGTFGATIKREFFQAHRHPVRFICFADHASMHMITVDEANHLFLWPYTADRFTGFG